MATRAERFKSSTARNGPDREPGTKPGGKRAGQRTPSAAKRMAQASPPQERRYGGPSTAARNVSAGKKAAYVLEDTLAPKRPSRKSSRAGKNRTKSATPLTSRQKLKVSSPAQQHQRGR